MSSKGTILVCGGAGYIGSHMCKLLARSGYTPVVFDNLSTGHRWAVKWGPLVEGDLLDSSALASLFTAYRFDAVMHFAAKIEVGESVREPLLYYRNNVAGTINLLDAMRREGVNKLVFSSTAAVYGIPEYTPIDEQHPCRPINPYGWSKLMAEQVIADACSAHDLRAVCLRYFNAAGADADGEIGEAHDPESHLIPNILKAALDPTLGPVKIFGSDYATSDGSCIRDYIHVEDLCLTHLNALHYLDRNEGCAFFNLGTGTGHTVFEVVAACRRFCNGQPHTEIQQRRSGDVPCLVANGDKAAQQLGVPSPQGLDSILRTALSWHSR